MQYYEVNNFRIRSSNSQQLEQVHRSSMSLEKKGYGRKEKKFCNCHSLICDAHGEQIALINPTTFSPAPVAVEDTEGKLKAWRLNFLLSSWLRCFYLNWKDDFSSSHKQILRSFDCCLVFIFMLSKYLVESDLQTREKRSSVQLQQSLERQTKGTFRKIRVTFGATFFPLLDWASLIFLLFYK